ncbi:MAG: YraN family protein [Candidatus Delongbacteria bacterium]|nr:YraN family protein [Candidatus Delongbacteria bacterium]
MHPSHIRGRNGERFAERYFRQRGYQVIARNWHHPSLGELDLILRRGRLLIFVEVKTTGTAGINPVEQVDAAKEQRLYRLAEAFIAEHSWAAECYPRLDVVAVYQQGAHWELVHYRDAVWG